MTPVVAGKLMGLDAGQVADAVGINGCHNSARTSRFMQNEQVVEIVNAISDLEKIDDIGCFAELRPIKFQRSQWCWKG